jgi:glycosyltransferase involved in cell wall biosynthesis
MKVAHITSGVRGLASYALNLYNYFDKQSDHEVENLIISSAKWRKQPIPVFELDHYLIGKVLPWPKRIKQAEDKLLEFKPDILHHHHPAGRLDFYIAKFKNKLDVPMVCTVHMSVGSRKYFVDKVMNGFFLVVRRHVSQADVYVAISKFVKKQLEEMGGVPKERIVLLYAGVDENIFKPITREPHDTLEITFVGQIMLEKGIDLLINTVIELAKTRKVRLSIVGDGNFKSVLQARTQHNPEINWVGYLSGQDKVAECYAKSDVVVLPNRWDEAFSYIPLESMSCGTAIIASRVGGNAEAIVEGETGLLFNVGDHEELLRLLQETEMEKFWEMGQKGRQHVLKHFTLDRFGAKYRSLYDNLLNDPDHIRQID